METYQRFEGEDDNALIYRICKDKDLLGTWNAVADILNGLLGQHYTESTYRKKYNTFTQMFDSNRELFANNEKEIEMIREEQRRLEIEKVKFRDERNAWNEQHRKMARYEDTMEKLEKSLGNIGKTVFPTPAHLKTLKNTKDNTVLILLADPHFGQTFETYWGKYNIDVAKERLGQLLESVKEIQKRHKSNSCVVAVLGDTISGSIHKSIQVTNRENVIEQVKVATELIASFCYELISTFGNVKMIGVSGNHSRLEKKEDALHNERLDDLVYWGVDLMLSHTGNFEYISDANYDTGVAMLRLYEKDYVFVHGDMDGFSRSGVQNLVTMLRVIPEAVLCGHHHTCALDEVNGIKLVQGGSMVGAGDQFTVEKRIFGKPSQMVCICTDKGLETFYPVQLE